MTAEKSFWLRFRDGAPHACKSSWCYVSKVGSSAGEYDLDFRLPLIARLENLSSLSASVPTSPFLPPFPLFPLSPSFPPTLSSFFPFRCFSLVIGVDCFKSYVVQAVELVLDLNSSFSTCLVCEDGQII